LRQDIASRRPFADQSGETGLCTPDADTVELFLQDDEAAAFPPLLVLLLELPCLDFGGMFVDRDLLPTVTIYMVKVALFMVSLRCATLHSKEMGALEQDVHIRRFEENSIILGNRSIVMINEWKKRCRVSSRTVDSLMEVMHLMTVLDMHAGLSCK